MVMFFKGSCSCGVAMWMAILASREVKRNKPYRVRRMGEDMVFWRTHNSRSQVGSSSISFSTRSKTLLALVNAYSASNLV